MGNYFNTLSLRDQLAQLGKCDFMEASEFSEGIDALKGKKVVIVGCGAQGLNQGLNMRDSGLDVSYTLREGAIAEDSIITWQPTMPHNLKISIIQAQSYIKLNGVSNTLISNGVKKINITVIEKCILVW